MNLRVEPETEADHSAIATLVAQAFGRVDEALLIERMRIDGDICLSLVARDDDGLAGHVAFQDLSIEPPQAGLRLASLAPLAVTPSAQGKGVGSALVRAGLIELAARGYDAVFVLGDPAYYNRFGFSAEEAAGYDVNWAGQHFMARRLSSRPMEQAGALIYPQSFFFGAI